jgi:hypothetical protein
MQNSRNIEHPTSNIERQSTNVQGAESDSRAKAENRKQKVEIGAKPPKATLGRRQNEE